MGISFFIFYFRLIIISVSLLSCKQNPEAFVDRKNSNLRDSVEFVEASEGIVKSRLALSMEKQGLVDIQTLDKSICVDLKYATTDNFTNTILYDTLFQAYLHPLAAEKLVKAQQSLKEIHPGYSLLVYDAARPISVQKKMYDKVRNTKYRAYVANPDRIGMHNYGMAVDLTICNSEGLPLDMGTPFDYFGRAAGINREEQLKNEGVLSREQISNRQLLRKVMKQAGFITIRGEWWHFNALSHSEAKKISKVIE